MPRDTGAALAEARVAAALNHPNLCTIYAVDDSAGVPIISMEYIAGESLSKVVAPNRLPTDALLSITRQIASGMAAAHSEGVVHGDLKPENVMVTADGVVKVLDFGLAKRLRGGRAVRLDETADLGLAEAGDGLFGTPRYLSPEQVRGEPATHPATSSRWGYSFTSSAPASRLFPAKAFFMCSTRSARSTPMPLPFTHPTRLPPSFAECSPAIRATRHHNA